MALTAGIFVQTARADIGVTVTNYNTTTPPLASSYTSLALALADLNLVTAMTQPITFTLAAGTSETAPPTGLTIGSASLNAVLSATNTVTIVIAGGTVTLNAGIGTATPASPAPDGILKIAGADYITIDGLTFTDGNAANPATMEFGLALFKLSVTNGAQNNTIQNCIFNMQRINNANTTAPMVEGSVGILVINSIPTAATTPLVPTAASGSNSNNKFYTNTTNGGNYGIVLSGYAAPTPFTLGDTGNDIGGTSTGQGNTILNYGGAAGATNPAAGIRANNQWGVNISYNSINNNDGSGVNHPLTLRGIYAQAGTSASANINYNQITIKGGALTSQVTAIENAIGSTAASNTININHNTITGDYLTATSGLFYGIFNSSSAANVNITYNNISDISYSEAALAGSGVLYAIYNSGAAGTVFVDHNTIDGISRTGITGGTMRGIYLSSGTTQTVTYNTVTNMSISGTGTASIIYGIDATGTTTVISKNNVNNINNLKTTGTSSLIGIYDGGSPTNETCDSNTVHSLTNLGTGAMYGIYHTTTTGTRTVSLNTIYGLSSGGTTVIGMASASSSPNIFKNKIYNITSTSTASPTVSGLQIAALGTAGNANVYNNLIGDIKAPNASSSAVTSPTVRGINITTTTTFSTLNLHYNTIYLNASSTGTNFGTAGIFVTASATATTAVLNLRNNILVNNSTPAGTGYAVAYQRTLTSLANYGTPSDYNLFYAGTSGSANLIMFDGTNSYPTLAEYKTAVGPVRDAFSITDNPTFVSTTGSDNTFLHINTGISTGIESGGTNIATYTDDVDGDIRQGNPGYVGNGSAPDIGADEFEGLPSYTCTTPNPGNTVTTANTLCMGQSITLSLQNATTGSGNSFQWQSSPDGITYGDISGATIATYLVTPTDAMYYQCIVTCQNGPVSATSSPIQITFANNITSTTPGSRCGIGTVELAATGNTGTTVKWYDVLTGGTALYTGSPFTTPEISTTTSYFAACETYIPGSISIGTGSSSSSTYSPFLGTDGGIKYQYLFSAAELAAAGILPGDITSITFTSTTATSYTYNEFYIDLGTTALTEFATPVNIQGGVSQVYYVASYSAVLGANTFVFNTPYSWNGTSNIIISTSWSNNNTSNTSTSMNYTSTSPLYLSQYFRGDNQTGTYMHEFTGGTGTGTFNRYTSRPNITFGAIVACSSPREEVVATVTPPPALTLTANQTICNNTIATLTVTSNIPDYDSYIWSPITDLFTDNLCTTPYSGTSASTVYFKSATAGITSYICTGSNSSTLCVNKDTTLVTNLPGSIAITATPDNHCLSGSSELTTIPATGYGNAILQWQNSTNNISFSDIPGANSISYPTPLLTGTTYYKLKVNSGSTACTESNVATITVNSPQVTGTTPGTRCGPGIVELGATGTSGTLNWYAGSTGGVPLGYGSQWTTPVISSTTSYYVSETLGGSNSYVSKIAPEPTSTGTTLSTYGQDFTITTPITLNSVKVFSTTGTSITISLYSSGGALQLFTSGATSVAAGTSPTISLGWPINPGTYRLVANGMTGAFIRDNTGVTYPFPLGTVGTMNGFVSSITGTVTTSSSYYFMYNWNITSYCESSRTPVVATVTPTQPLTITGDQALCANLITSMNVTSTVTDYDTYTWSPVTGLYTDPQCTVPYVALGNTPTVYVKISAMGTYPYICTAFNTANNCGNLDTCTITIYPPVTATASATPDMICSGSNSQLLVLPDQYVPSNATDYVFSYSVDTYTEISGGTILGDTLNDDHVFNNDLVGIEAAVTNTGFPIGFTVRFGTLLLDKFAVSSNGYIVLGTGTFTCGYTASAALSTTTVNGFANVIAAFNNDLGGQYGSELSYLTTGTAPNRVLTVQWKKYKPYGNPTGTNDMNFQIKVYEGNNVVKFCYATNTITTTETGGVGLRTVDNTNVHTRTTTTNWSATTQGTYSNTCTMSATVYPASGATFTFTPPLVPFTYLWSPTTFIPAGQELIQNPIATAVTATTNYSVTVTGNYGCSKTVDNVIVTVPGSANIITQPVSVSGCSGQTATFTIDVYGANLTYQWRRNSVDIPIAGNPSAGTDSLVLTNISALDNGIYDVVITTCGSPLTSDGTSTLTVKPVPTAAAANTAPLCSGGTLLLSGTTDIGTLFSWTGPDGFISGDQNPIILSAPYAAAGIYSFTSSLDGCSSTDTTHVMINPSPEFTITPNAPTILPGDIQQLISSFFSNLNNGTIVNSPGTGAGSLDESWLYSPLTNYGYSMNHLSSFSVADDFTVTGGDWDVTSLEVYGYQTLSGNTSTFTGIYVQVWNGDPSLPGSTVVWGDMITNRLANTYFDNIYRVNAALNTDRPVMKIIASTPGLSLAPGTYWVEFSTTGSASYTGPWVPPVAITGTNITGNALQGTAGTFTPLLDGTYNQGVPFILKGAPTVVTWSPETDLYTDAAAAIPYVTGTDADTVWSKPAATITYTATATTTAPCTSSQNVTITVAPTTKTLTVTAFLEGLYDGAGGMYEAQGLAGPEFPGYADQVTVELHNSVNYATIEYASGPVNLSTDGVVTVNDIPSGLTGSYYITIKHRSSIETTSGVPVSFAVSPVSYNFTTASSQAYGDNMKLMGTAYTIWGGDVNLDGLVDSGDMNPVENASTAITFGYVVEDVNGDGLVDSGDMNIVENNSINIVGVITP